MNKVAVYYSNDDIRIEEFAIPHITDGEILVKMKASGICGTDVMQWYRQRKVPCILGHEMAGEIVEVGKGVRGFNIGNRVFVSHHVPCYRCFYCTKGQYTACEALHKGNYDPGGFAEYIRISEETVRYGTFLLPESMTYEEATMVEPLGCVIAGQRSLGLNEGCSVLIIGSGVSGLLHIQLAKLKGAFIVATDINEYRLTKAKEFGANHVIDANNYSIEELKSVNNGRLAEIVIVCAGAKKAVIDALSSIDRKGIILFFAIPDMNIALPSTIFWRNEISVTFSYGASPDDLKEAIGLMNISRIDVSKMITNRVTLSNVKHGFKLVSEAKGSLKVVVVSDNIKEKHHF